MVASAIVTLYTLILGDANNVGRYERSYSASDMEAAIVPKSAQQILQGTGLLVRLDALGVSVDPVQNDDVVKNSNGDYFQVSNLQPVWYFDTFMYYTYDLQRLPMGLNTEDEHYSTSDPRYRTIEWIDDELDTGNILLDDNATPASALLQYSHPPYNLERILSPTGKDVDVVFSVESPETEPIQDWNGATFAYNEKVPISIACITKADVTASNLKYRAEQELRRLAEEYYLGSYRTINKIRDVSTRLGAYSLAVAEVILSYERESEDDIYNSGVSFSYGHGFLDDFTRRSFTASGWYDGGIFFNGPTVDDVDWMSLAHSGGATAGKTSFPDENGADNLALATDIYKRCLIRYRTSNTAVQPVFTVVYGDASTDVISPGDSVDVNVVDTALTAAKTINHIRIEATAADGIVYVDFVLFYMGNFTLPNIRYGMTPNYPVTPHVKLKPLGMDGAILQNMGSDLATYSLSCDLTKASNDYKWTRSDIAVPDQRLGEVFMDIIASSRSAYQPWVWFSTPLEAMKVCITDFKTPREANGSMMNWKLNLEVSEYRASSAGITHETYRTRWLNP